MGNCGGAPKEMTLETYMQKYHPPEVKPNPNNFELNKKVLTGLNSNIISSKLVEIKSTLATNESQSDIKQTPTQTKAKINEFILREGARLGSRSSIPVFQARQEQKELHNSISVENMDLDRPQTFQQPQGNPFDVNLLDMKETILFQGSLHKFHFNEFQPYYERYIVVTKNAVRVYENKQKAMSTYGRPLMAIPLSAVRRVDRIKFDMSDDPRLQSGAGGLDQKTALLNQHMFEFLLKDEFLPIYSHQQYTRMFKDTSVMVELSPNRRKSKLGGLGNTSVNASPSRRESSISKKNVSMMSSQQQSPGKKSLGLEVNKRAALELKESPSKAAKIVLRYINSFPDVGPQVANAPITYQDLQELAQTFDKREFWVRSDLRLIFAIEDSQIIDETIESLNRILLY